MINEYLISAKKAFKLLLSLFFLCSVFQGFSQELVLEDEFDSFDFTNTEKYKCNKHWGKWEYEEGKFAAQIGDIFEEADAFGIKCTLEAGDYYFKTTVKTAYGGEQNLQCFWNKSSEAGLGAKIHDAAIVDGAAFKEIKTADFNVSEAGEYVFYIYLSTPMGNLAVDVFSLYKKEGLASSCDAPANFDAKAEGTIAKLNWERPLQEQIYETKFATAFPPEGWEIVKTNDYGETMNWHKFTLMTSEPIPFSDSGCAAVFFDADFQDEWLIYSVPQDAAYLDFWFWMSNYILELRKQTEFEDHYYVKISYDGGKTWEVLWDAAKSCLGTNDWESVSLYLGEVNENTKLAFHALSSEKDGLYLNWFIDDVKISKVPSGNSPVHSFNLYRNEVKLLTNWKSSMYTDENLSDGKYTYCVTANYYGEDTCESEKLCKEINIGGYACNPPQIKNVTVKPNTKVDDTYDVQFYWDEPEYSGRDVYYYKCYRNTSIIALWTEEQSFGQTEVTEGVYRYGVSAVYRQPDCESEITYVDVVVGDNNCLSTTMFSAEVKEDEVKLTWNKREGASYILYRAEEKIAEGIKDTFFIEEKVPNGIYDYCVLADYGDCVSDYDMYSCITVDIGEPEVHSLPFEENFSTGFKPKDWQSIDLTEKDNAFVWRFNNPSKRKINGNGFDDGFVIMDSDYFGLSNLQNSALISPAINCSGQKSLELSFDMQFPVATEMAQAILCISKDKGETWIELETLSPQIIEKPTDEIKDPQNVKFTLAEELRGAESIMIRWEYSASYDLWIALDNISLKAPTKNEEMNQKSLSLYPNPAKDVCVIKGLDQRVENIYIYDICGRLCKTHPVKGDRADINISNLKSGIYQVFISSSEGNRVLKLVKD